MNISPELFRRLSEVAELDEEDLTSFGTFVIYNSDAKKIVEALRTLEVIRSLLVSSTVETLDLKR